jgi:hypothetical protein
MPHFGVKYTAGYQVGAKCKLSIFSMLMSFYPTFASYLLWI